MATYNDINEAPITPGSTEVATEGSATLSTPDTPGNYSPYGGHDHYDSERTEGPTGIMGKLGVIGAVVVICGGIIACSGLAAAGGTLNAVETLCMLLPVVLTMLMAFRSERLSHRELVNTITVIFGVCEAVWSFFVFILNAVASSTGSKVTGAAGAAAAGFFFVFSGEATIAAFSIMSM